MDTNTKQFQDALQNLSTAFIQFLNVVNPDAITREADILYISQSLRTLTSHLGHLGQTNPDSVSMKVSTPSSNIAPEVPTSVQSVSSRLPEKPNLFREQPFYDKRTGNWVFDRPRPMDGDTKLFQLYTNDTEGEFEMKPISAENWMAVFESKDKILPQDVVVVEGEITPTVQSTPTARGLLRKEGNLWHVVQPCHIRVTSI